MIHKWKTFNKAAKLPKRGCPSRFTPRPAKESGEKLPGAATLQASFSMLNVKVHVVEKRLNLN